MSTKTYDPKSVFTSFLGNLMSGFAEDTMIEAERNEDAFTLTIGADGEGARSRSRNKSGKVTFTLMQSSSSNDILSAAAALDELSGTGIGPLLIKDGSGTTVLSAQNAWVMKLPATQFGKTLGDRQWVLECEQLEMFVGGVL